MPRIRPIDLPFPAPQPASGRMDLMDKEGARYLARQVAAYWSAAGFPIDPPPIIAVRDPTRAAPIFRPDLSDWVNGCPPSIWERGRLAKRSASAHPPGHQSSAPTQGNETHEDSTS